jgi:uridine kinase
MTETAKRGMEIEKVNIPIEEANALSKEFSMHDKVEFLKYRRASNVNFYKLDWFYNYFYGQMIPNTSYLTNFKLVPWSRGFILQFPSPKGDGSLNPLLELEKISSIFKESRTWSKILKVSTVGELNGIIVQGKFGDFIRASEALHEKKIGAIADFVREGGKRIILIAGPSSSGKTTFAERLSIQLRVNGLKPHVISLDNYFKERELVPYDEFGQPDYEAFDYMNTELLNDDLKKLLNGEKTDMPTFDFVAGRPAYKGNYLQLKSGDVLILEGIHGLNENLTYSIPRGEKCKVFISALTQLAIDDHNRIPTTDTRLIRRIIRDYSYRGMPATRTIGMWPSVSRGEAKHIFPYQEEADAIFNSALVYEMCILKLYVEPLLFGIDKDDINCTEARRLIKFLDSFLGMSSEEIPNNSILREFIGGSCFNT